MCHAIVSKHRSDPVIELLLAMRRRTIFMRLHGRFHLSEQRRDDRFWKRCPQYARHLWREAQNVDGHALESWAKYIGHHFKQFVIVPFVPLNRNDWPQANSMIHCTVINSPCQSL